CPQAHLRDHACTRWSRPGARCGAYGSPTLGDHPRLLTAQRRGPGACDQQPPHGPVTYARLVYRVHAVERMAERAIGDVDVRLVLDSGEVIADYQGDLPYPSRLVLAWLGP